MTYAPDVTLEQGESLVPPGPELVFRQITTHHINNGAVALHAFGPAGIDDGKASYSRSSIVTAQEARDWFSKRAKSASVGVYGVKVDEVIEAGRFAIDDSGAPESAGSPRAPGHCYIDFRGLEPKEIRDARTQLYWSAMSRGEIPTVAQSEATGTKDVSVGSASSPSTSGPFREQGELAVLSPTEDSA